VRLACLAAAACLPSEAVGARQQGAHEHPFAPPRIEARFPEERSIVEVPFRFVAGKILVDVAVNGSRPLVFVLDTGAPLAVILKGERLDGIEVDYRGVAQVGGAGGSGQTRTARLAGGVRLDVGGLSLEGASLVVMPEGGDDHLGEHAWDGIFGGDLFSSTVVEIDWPSKTLRIHDRERFAAPEGTREVPLVSRSGHVFVTAELAIDGEARSVELVVDTGASHALALDPARVPPPARRLAGATLGRGLNGVLRGDVARVERLSLGGVGFEGVVTSFPADAAQTVAVGADGNLGTEVLRRFVVTFDYPRSRMLLAPTDAAAEPFAFPTSGMSTEPWIAADGTVGVDDVHPGSPAERAGIAVGDRLVAAGSRPVGQLGVDALRKLLSQAPGTRVTLVVRRGDERREVELELATVL
jgi:hypothetical protein